MKTELLKNGEFIIKDYDKKKTFASFLPGIAGIHGIPLWCHYTNRAQAITSFGLRDKNGCILEFYPANTAYRIVDKMGFRTFIKLDNEVFEPFSIRSTHKVDRTMYVSNYGVRIEEIDNDKSIKTEVSYFILPEENIGGLVRRDKIINLSSDVRHIEVLDGLTQLLPTDANEWMLKNQSNLLKSWMDVRLINDKIGFYFENSIPSDTAEVNVSSHGNYYMSFVDGELTKTIYDLNNIFSYDVSLNKPVYFMDHSVDEILGMDQVAADKVSGGFSGVSKEIKDELSIDTIIGYAETEEFILSKLDKFSGPDFFNTKEKDAKELIHDIIKDVETSSNQELFDEYMKQNYLDNILRGGIPYFIDTPHNHFVYHLFSRRHGDMEREYNFFTISPEYFSQGNGNFRDVCQNRRSDSLFHPEVGIFNAKMFAELVQLDGYNPLGVLGLTFRLKDISKAESLVDQILDSNKEPLINLLKNSFTPGAISNLIEREHLSPKVSEEEMFKIIFDEAYSNTEATFGEGYWVDHWTYILDLVESTEAVLPDKMNEYLFDDSSYRYYDSPVTVLPRSEKYVLNKHGKVRQYGALLENDEEKINHCHMNRYGTNWLKFKDREELVTTNLYSKLFSLAISKFTLLDPYGIGVAMEANKPGWNDAMNGLPGVFSSGVSETIELGRLVKFLILHNDNKEVIIPKEQKELILKTKEVYSKGLKSFDNFDSIHSLVETFRANTRFGVEGMDTIDNEELMDILRLMKEKIDKGLSQALIVGKGIFPTFISYEATEYEETGHIGHYGLPCVKVTSFDIKPLPKFLEAPARSMKYYEDKIILKNQYRLIKNTDIYDEKLHMYKTSGSLDKESFEIGRIRAFQKGWLERESNFLHMTYKYLLGLLKAGLYDEYFEEIKTNYVCFMDPDVYSRSVFENSSFIATSNNPDPNVVGQGFVARLSGSTAEALSMWNIMMFGEHPFMMEDGLLKLNLRPILTKEFFKEDNTLITTFISRIKVTYHLECDDPLKYTKVTYLLNGKEYEEISGELAEKIRVGEFKELDVYLK